MLGTYYIYSAFEVGAPADGSTIPNGGPYTMGTMDLGYQIYPDYMVISDDDTYLDGYFPSGSLDYNQVLAADLVVDGVQVGKAGDMLIAETGATISTNYFQVFDLHPVFTLDLAAQIYTFAGYVSSQPLSAGISYLVGEYPRPPDTFLYSTIANCFTQDTLIECAHGPVPVQDIQVGDRVVTRKHGLQTVRWVGRQKVEGKGEMAPVRFKAGVLGNTADLLVSPMHRMLISGVRAELLFGQPEMLAHAAHLCDGDRIFREPCAVVTYYHILFDRHEIVCAHGCWSESFAPSEATLSNSDAQTRAELLKLFPQLLEAWKDALPTLNACESALLGHR